MSAQVIPFRFKNTEVRTLEIDSLIWFVASDVAKSLHYRNADDMTRMLDDDEKGTHNVRTLKGDQEMVVINESGLYHALLKSRKPEAQPFRKWVTAEVLPAIRKTGSYEASPARLPAPPVLPMKGKPYRVLMTFTDGQCTAQYVPDEACVLTPEQFARELGLLLPGYKLLTPADLRRLSDVLGVMNMPAQWRVPARRHNP